VFGEVSSHAEKIDAFARKGYIRSIIDAVEVDDRAIRIIGSTDFLQAAIAGKQTENGNVRGKAQFQPFGIYR